MKNFLLAGLLAVLPLWAFAKCHLGYMTYGAASNQEMQPFLKQLVELPQYDQICQRLQRANAEILFDGMAKVSNGTSIGESVVVVVDPATGLAETDFQGGVIITSRNASDTEAEELLREATAKALATWVADGNFDKNLAGFIAGRPSGH